MLTKTLITISLLIYPMTSLFSAEKDSPTFLIGGVLSGGSEIVNYGPINNILGLYSVTDQSVKGISDNYMLGIKGALINDRMIIITSILLNHDKHLIRFGPLDQLMESGYLHYRLSNAVKIGIPLFSGRQDILFPYFGIGLETLLINTDFLLGFSGEPFFHDKNDYLIYNIALLYGLAYEHPILLLGKNWSLPFGVVIGIDAGGMISSSHRRWIINGKPESNDNAPEFDMRDFMVRVHLDIGLFKR